jgi:hypothetical protein
LHGLRQRILVVGVTLGDLDTINPRMIFEALWVSGKHPNPVSVIQQLDNESAADVSGRPGHKA